MPAKHRSGGPPSSEHHRITSSRLVRFVDQPHGRAQNRDSFGAAARFTRQPSPTMAYPPRATTEDLERIPRTVSPSFALPERISPTVNGCGAIRSTVLNVVCGKSCWWKTSQLIRSVRTATRFRPSAVSAAATPRFVHKSVHNTARSKCSNRRLRAVTAELGYPDKRGARVVARSLRSPTHRPDPDAFLPAANGVQPAPHVSPEPQRARRRVS